MLRRWSLPNTWPSIVLNGATGTKDALSVTFRATFSNMVNIIGKVLSLARSFRLERGLVMILYLIRLSVAFCISI